MKLIKAAPTPAPTSKKSSEVRPIIKALDPKMVDDLADQLGEMKTLEGSVKAIKGQLTDEVMPNWLRLNRDSSGYNSSVIIQGENRSVMMTFKGAFTEVPEANGGEIIDAIGEEKFNEHFFNRVVANVDFNKVPEDKVNDLYTEVQELFAKYGASEAFTLKSIYRPKEDFNKVRASQLTIRQNERLEEIQKTVVQFKVQP